MRKIDHIRRTVFLLASCLVLLLVLRGGAVRPVHLAPDIEPLLTEEGEEAFYRYFRDLQLWYNDHRVTSKGVTLTRDADYNRMYYIMEAGGIYFNSAEESLKTAGTALQQRYNDYNIPFILFLGQAQVGIMMGLSQSETMTYSQEGWAALGESIDLLVDCYQG